MDDLNREILKFPVQESCGEEEEKDSRTPEILEKTGRQENGSHSKELSFRSKLENTSSVAQSLDHDTKTDTLLLPYGIQCTEDLEKFQGVQSTSSLNNFESTSKQTEARDRKRKFWQVKLPEFPSQPYKNRRIENGALRKLKLPECPPKPFKKRRIASESLRARKKIEFRGCKRNFRDMKDRKGPSQPLKMKKIGNEGKRLVEKSENRCRTHWGHENNRPCSNSFDPGGSRQANSQVRVVHLVFALQILHL